MHQMPPSIEVSEGTSHRRVAADSLEKIVNSAALAGWEFYRVDTIGVRENPGCISGLFGASVTTISYYVITFRRKRAV
jgi:hypothetical protein